METMKEAPPLVRVPVKSSAVASIGYNPQSRLMQVEMVGNQKVYDYPNVSPEDHDEFLNRPIGGSHGKHLAAHIRPKYSTVVKKA